MCIRDRFIWSSSVIDFIAHFSLKFDTLWGLIRTLSSMFFPRTIVDFNELQEYIVNFNLMHLTVKKRFWSWEPLLSSWTWNEVNQGKIKSGYQKAFFQSKNKLMEQPASQCCQCKVCQRVQECIWSELVTTWTSEADKLACQSTYKYKVQEIVMAPNTCLSCSSVFV